MMAMFEAMPAPDTWTVAKLSWSVTVMEPESVETAVGEYFAVTVQLLPDAIAVPQVFVWVTPVGSENARLDVAVLPVLVSVKVFESDCPVATLPKASVPGLVVSTV